MKPRKSVLAISMAGLVLLFSLLAVPTANAERSASAPFGPIGEGPGIEDPGGGFGGGDGGDPDEYLLVDQPDHTPQLISDDARDLTAGQASLWKTQRFRIWLIGFLFNMDWNH